MYIFSAILIVVKKVKVNDYFILGFFKVKIVKWALFSVRIEYAEHQLGNNVNYNF